MERKPTIEKWRGAVSSTKDIVTNLVTLKSIIDSVVEVVLDEKGSESEIYSRLLKKMSKEDIDLVVATLMKAHDEVTERIISRKETREGVSEGDGEMTLQTENNEEEAGEALGDGEVKVEVVQQEENPEDTRSSQPTENEGLEDGELEDSDAFDESDSSVSKPYDDGREEGELEDDEEDTASYIEKKDPVRERRDVRDSQRSRTSRRSRHSHSHDRSSRRVRRERSVEDRRAERANEERERRKRRRVDTNEEHRESSRSNTGTGTDRHFGFLNINENCKPSEQPWQISEYLNSCGVNVKPSDVVIHLSEKMYSSTRLYITFGLSKTEATRQLDTLFFEQRCEPIQRMNENLFGPDTSYHVILVHGISPKSAFKYELLYNCVYPFMKAENIDTEKFFFYLYGPVLYIYAKTGGSHYHKYLNDVWKEYRSIYDEAYRKMDSEGKRFANNYITGITRKRK